MRAVAVTLTLRGTTAAPKALRCLLPSLIALTLCALPVHAEGPIFANGPFAGIDVGASIPTNANYRAHVDNGATANPFVGYMFTRYLGAQGQVYATLQTPDNSPRRGYPNENQITSVLGITVGPRLALPVADKLELHATFQVGGYTGTSGSMNHTAPGFSTGAGLNYYLTPQLGIGAFGRWNRVYMAPRPITLTNPSLPADEQGPQDAQFAMGGVSLTYRFNRPETPPPPRPPVQVEPPPPPPVKKAIVLRAVHFEFNSADLRPDVLPILDEAATMLNSEGKVRVVVVGYTDGVGSDAHNSKLSKQRADAVAKHLVSRGVSTTRVRTEGAGSARPVASNDTEEGRAQNRRVELRVE